MNQQSREQFENIVIFGLWLSKSKTLYHNYCEKVVEKLKVLIEQPVLINSEIIFIYNRVYLNFKINISK
jgi:hypothetical protein